MTRTQFTDARRNTAKQIIPWISIVVIGMVSLVAYLSLIYGSEAIRQTVSDYYNTYDFWDLEITSTLLMDEEDLTAIRALPGVKQAESVWTAVAQISGETDTTVTVQSLGDAISLPELLAGRLPEAVGECAIEEQLEKTLGLGIGDHVPVSCPAVAGLDPLRSTEFVVTGVFRHPDHISFELPEAPYLLTTRDSFNLEGLDGAFMKIRVRVENAPAARYSAEYLQTIKPMKDAIEALQPERTAAREEKIRAFYEDQILAGQEKLDEASAQLDEASAQLEDAQLQLDDGREKLAAAREELDRGWSELKEAEEKLNSARQQLDDGSRILVEAEYQIASLQGLLYKAEGLIGIIDSLTGASPEDYLPGSITSQIQQARDGLRQYSQGRDLWYSSGEEYLDGLTQFEQGKKRLEQAEQDYEEGRVQYEEGQARYEEGRAQYEQGQADYAEGVKQLAEAKAQAADIGTCRWMVVNTSGNTGYVFAENQASGLSSMSYAFSSLFLVIAVLVIYATVGRMVQEQRALIGTSKALGLYNREILAKYMFFGLSAAITSVVLGVVLTYFVVQPAALANYEPFFTFGSIPLCFRPVETAVVAVVLPLSAGISVWFACSGLIRIPAIRLLQGEQPKLRRKVSRHSSSRGLYSRLILRNIQTDLRRVLVTIVSIAGCCSLLTGGFLIKHAIERVNARQFSQVIQFQAELFFDPKEAEARQQLRDILEENGLPYVLVGKSDFLFRAGESLNTATAVIAEPGSLDGFYGLKDPKTGASLRPAEEGVLIPIRLSNYHHIGPGDRLEAYDSALAEHEIPVSAVFTNHFGNLLFFTPDLYEAIFDTAAEPNCFLIRLTDMRLEELEDRVGDVAGFRLLKDASADRARLDSLSSVLNAMIFLLLGLAGVMAYFIVMNLSVTYIQQKTRELTIMRINGFTVRECVTYVSWDLVVTTCAGILLGLVLGHFLGEQALDVTEGPFMYFVHDPDVRTYLYATLITAGFSVLISSTSLRKVKDLKLSDII